MPGEGRTRDGNNIFPTNLNLDDEQQKGDSTGIVKDRSRSSSISSSKSNKRRRADDDNEFEPDDLLGLVKLNKQDYSRLEASYQSTWDLLWNLATDNRNLHARVIELELEKAQVSQQLARLSASKQQYSDMAKKTPPVKAPSGKKKAPRKTFTAIMKSEGKDQAELKKRITQNLDPVKSQVHVNSIRTRRDGSLLLEAETRKDLDTILSIAPDLAKDGIVLSETNKSPPRLIVYDVPKEYDDAYVTNAIIQQNEQVKVLEKLISKNIMPMYTDPNHASDRQYGYKEGRSTEDAISEVLRDVKGSPHNLVLAILFDVTGAFDNLRWSSVLDELARRNCPGNTYRLIRSYLSERKVSVLGKYESAHKELDKGCPQGSILGPLMWNLCADGLLRTIDENDGDAYMYADDLVILIKGESRRQLELRGQAMTDVIKDWFGKQGLQISKSKTEMIVLRERGNQTGNKRGTKKRILKQTTGSVAGSLKKARKRW
ncbi:unnamed protein product [Trichogramma brassicae]|uniref:Reverse transcriptase domain-containing protein n=1 Tax=Trichogramma brassicae TaxID=86971 RepID=A0A6H5IX10_9HYME|nr:unnamed protein product [Trichogramma brassicae]